VRNWDYRYCWLRDATFTLYSFVSAGYLDEARAWREWLLRAVAGKPSEIQILYGLAGERRLTEFELPWLPGYEGSAPFGSVTRRRPNFSSTSTAKFSRRCITRAALPGAEGRCRARGQGVARLSRIGLGQAGRRHLGSARSAPALHSFRMMAWVAFDRAVKAAARFGFEDRSSAGDNCGKHSRSSLQRGL